jgi:two-component system KDP operon response regulator KdpE
MSVESARILVVDDERPIRKFLKTTLSAQGFYIFEAVNGHEALVSAASFHPDVIILDLGLPDMDGLEVIRQLREWSQTPVIILSVREQEQVKVRALDSGADDYLTKPFGVGELLARIRVALRRSAKSEDEPVFKVEGLKIDLARRQVLLEEKEIALSPIEYEILKVLVQHAGRVLTHRQILQKVWGGGYEDQAHLLRVTVSHLRKKIEKDSTRPGFILTEPGVGYRLKTDD